ncbi:hypothetical protein [Novosphingobium resinovorum]|uniref:hypothetical protein n=1 Tax=Novosphingobium resinovorum TaxID=158500 RepID=UPI0012EAC81F|nr:hypothetical protein [Novosphingobium resinovorum]
MFDSLSIVLFPVMGYSYLQYLHQGGTRGNRMPVVAIVSSLLMMMATLLSSLVATDLESNLFKGFFVGITLALTALNIYFIFAGRIIAPKLAFEALVLSATLHSLCVIAQGQFGLFLQLSSQEWQGWSRATGLAEHPIEAGMSTAVGILCAVHLLFDNPGTARRFLLLVAATAICLISLTYSASLTAGFGLLTALLIQALVARRAHWLFGVVPALLLVLSVVLPYISDSQLGNRLSTLAQTGGNYGTVQSRSKQIVLAISKIDAPSALIGKSFDMQTTPMGMEIHNGFVAALYYFGLLGFISQLMLIVFSIRRATHQRWLALKGTFFGILIVFATGYLTGPGLSRRSVWVPILLVAAMPVVTPPLRLPQRRGRGRGFGNAAEIQVEG